eukprot:6342925-Ditylum_brightwellii.AAC.1
MKIVCTKEKNQEDGHVYGDDNACNLSGETISMCTPRLSRQEKSQDNQFLRVHLHLFTVEHASTILKKLFNMEIAEFLKNEEPADDDIAANFLKGLL